MTTSDARRDQPGKAPIESMPHLNASTGPVIGFKNATGRTAAGSVEIGYTTGVTKYQNPVTYARMNLKSRARACQIEVHRLHASASASAIPAPAAATSSRGPGVTYHMPFVSW